MDCKKLLDENMAAIQTGVLVLVAVMLIMMVFKERPAKDAESLSNNIVYPSPALGLGTSNVMGFYQGFDQLHGPGSSSYSASDKAYAAILRKDSGRDMMQADGL